MNPDSNHLARDVMPAELLPVSGFIVPPAKAAEDHPLHDLILRVNAGSLAYLRVPSPLVYRWACLCRRWAPDLQVFVAQALRHTGNLDHFLVQPAAVDHHSGSYGLLEASISAAELAMDADHEHNTFRPLPAQVDELQQVCAAAAFLFDLGKVFDPSVADDRPRAARVVLTPYTDLSRCWRSSWKALHARNPVIAAWLYHLARARPSRAAAVKAARSLTHNAVKAAWRTPSVA